LSINISKSTSTQAHNTHSYTPILVDIEERHYSKGGTLNVIVFFGGAQCTVCWIFTSHICLSVCINALIFASSGSQPFLLLVY